MQKLVIFAAFVVIASAVPVTKVTQASNDDLLWDRFKATYPRAFFDSRDESYRKSVFISNLRKITRHNEEADQGLHTYTMAMNEFGDMTTEEFFTKYTGYRGPRNDYLRSKNTQNLTDIQVADDVDWVAKGAVTPVKNQGQCGSCWAFSSTGAIEGAWKIAKGQLVSLSEQQLMDCSTSEGNQSCNGGLMDYAFEYVKSKGLGTEAAYPYKAKDEKCERFTVAATISGYTDVAQTDAGLIAAINQQPVSVAIEADQSAFQFYSKGVLTGACGTQLDHGVLAVGYGTLDNKEYYKVKNSWGASWGQEGYVLIERGKSQKGGQCGILMAASYPTV